MQQIIGKLIDIMPVVSGETERGQWQRGGFVLEVGNEYPKKVAFTTFNDAIGIVNVGMKGSTVTVSYNPESREFNGRWYTDLKALRASVYQPTVAQGATVAAAPAPAAATMPKESDGDLPF